MRNSISGSPPGSASRKQRTRIPATALLAAILGLIVFVVLPKPLPELSRAEFLAEVRSGHVRKVEVEDKTITGTSATRGAFRTPLNPDGAELVAELRSLGVEIVYTDFGRGLI